MSPLTILLEAFDHLSHYQEDLSQQATNGSADAALRLSRVKTNRRNIATLIGALEIRHDKETQQARLPL